MEKIRQDRGRSWLQWLRRGPEDAADGAPAAVTPIDLEQVTRDFDFARAFDGSLPPEQRVPVLRRLWSTCPDLFAPDGLDVYCEDFTRPSPIEIAEKVADVVVAAAAVDGGNQGRDVTERPDDRRVEEIAGGVPADGAGAHGQS